MLGRVIQKVTHTETCQEEWFKKQHGAYTVLKNILRIENNVSNNDPKEHPTYRKNVSKNCSLKTYIYSGKYWEQ